MNNDMQISLDRDTRINDIYTNIEQVPSDKIMRFVFNSRFAQCVVSHRKRLGLTQEDLAKKSGVNRVTIAKIESFQRLASTEVILKLADALDLEIQFVERSSVE